jgi:hypothetical protein
LGGEFDKRELMREALRPIVEEALEQVNNGECHNQPTRSRAGKSETEQNGLLEAQVT